MTQNNGNGHSAERHRDRAAEIANTFEWLITAFILAFVFRAFVMEAFRIPTGSMADTLKGAHFRLRCSQCAYPYDYGFVPGKYRYREDYIPVNVKLDNYPSRCPSCGFYQDTGGTMPVSNGDRILVLKCIYQFTDPKRWDVIVFKNPLDPRINYIKRLIALPGEEIEIIDGDIYIDGKIQRKPPKVQNEHWMPVYDNDFLPARPELGSFNGHAWSQPFANLGDSHWAADVNHPTTFHLNTDSDELHRLAYDTSEGNSFRAAYAYNEVREFNYRPYCSDLMVRFYCKSVGEQGTVGASLTKYGVEYRALVDQSGKMTLIKVDDDAHTVLAEKTIKPPRKAMPTQFKFANVDHMLVLEFGKDKLKFDFGVDPNSAGVIKADVQPQAVILGAGQLALSHVAIMRDIHYTSSKYAGSPPGGRAVGGESFKLEKDQFFVLGDNSPNSEDCRWWDNPGIGNRGQEYPEGIVPRDYLVGKALFVYWPGGFKPFARSRFALVPNIGQMRLIYGGSDTVD